MKKLQISLFLTGILILRHAALAADSPFTTLAENTWLKQSPREDTPAPGFF